VPTIEEIQIPFPPFVEQQTIIHQLDKIWAETQRLESLYERKIARLEELKKSLLDQAFTGQL
jgi:type I restriction enzyme S subunit